MSMGCRSGAVHIYMPEVFIAFRIADTDMPDIWFLLTF